MRAALEWIRWSVLGELATRARAGDRPPVPPYSADDVIRVAHAIDVADLVPVVGWNRDLGNAEALMPQLDDYLGVEMKVVGEPLEIDPGERVESVRAIAAVELGQLHAERAVLDCRENAVAEVLVRRHPAAEGAAVIGHHPRSEHRIGLAANQRRVER